MTNEELKEAIFMALGEASMCWDPLPSNQVFESTRAKEIGDKLVEKIMPILSQCEAMREALEWYADGANYAGKCDDYQDPNCPIWSETDNDRGDRARKALSHLGEGV